MGYKTINPVLLQLGNFQWNASSRNQIVVSAGCTLNIYVGVSKKVIDIYDRPEKIVVSRLYGI